MFKMMHDSINEYMAYRQKHQQIGTSSVDLYTTEVKTHSDKLPNACF